MSFYKRSFHSFLGQTKTKTMPFNDETRNPGGIEFADQEADGLMLCTEYLGFESYDMRMSDKEVENKMTCHAEEETERVETAKKRKTKENVVARERKREFPPPLSSLNGRGQRSFYLRPMRKDGRLELTQVMIDRPEIFHTSREYGRLRLHLVDAYCDSKETGELEDERKGLDQPLAYFNNETEWGDISRSDLESDREINEDNDAAASDQVVDISKSTHEVSMNSNDDVTHFHDEHDAREWRYKSCSKIAASRNHDENDYHHQHQHHHHIHPYHHYSSNNKMHLWRRSYVTTR